LVSYLGVFRPPLNRNLASYYLNITGFIHGDATFHNVTPLHLSNNRSKEPWSNLAENLMVGVNMTDVNEKTGTWNWSASNKVTLSVVEKKPQYANGTPTVSDDMVLVHVCSFVDIYTAT